VIGWAQQARQSPRLRRWLGNRWLRLGAQALIVLFCLAYLAANLRSIQEARLELRLELVLLAGVVTVGAVFLGALGWWLTLRALGQPVGWGQAARVHLYSTLAKYAPGYAWQLLGKAYLTRQLGAPAGVVAAGMGLELALLVLAGLWVAATALPENLAASWLGEAFWPGGLWAARAGLLLALVGLPFGAAWLARRNTRPAAALRIQPWLALAALGAIVAGWWAFGFSYWMLGAALRPLPWEQVGLFTFTLAVSFLVGLAVVIVPASIGVRESMMVLILGPALGAPLAVVLAGLARLVLTLSELLSALGCWLAQKISR
jgi:hypothetical protein